MLKKDNIFLSSKLNDLCEGNTSLKNKIILVEKEKENISKKKKVIDSHTCYALHATIDKMRFNF